VDDSDLTPRERARRNLDQSEGWALAESEGRLQAEDVLGRILKMALYEFGETTDDWLIALDSEGFLTVLLAEGKRFDGGISVHVWPNDHPPPHVHILKKSESDSRSVKISLETGEVVGDPPEWATRPQLKNMRALIVKHRELFSNWWEKNQGEPVTLMS
jgi:hypothetical protein